VQPNVPDTAVDSHGAGKPNQKQEQLPLTDVADVVTASKPEPPTEVSPQQLIGQLANTKQSSKSKRCTYLCGSECWVTADPIDATRRSIRWAYDSKDIVGVGKALP